VGRKLFQDIPAPAPLQASAGKTRPPGALKESRIGLTAETLPGPFTLNSFDKVSTVSINLTSGTLTSVTDAQLVND
jgi:hypothetical protein